MLSEQKLRAFLFYVSVLVFLAGLPFILSFALGYKFDRRAFKFTKTGLIVLKTQPPGASIYFNEKLLNDRTPVTLNELLPGTYNIRLELENYYPWEDDIGVEAGKVTRIEKIIFFPLRPNVKQLNKEKISIFWIDPEKDNIYYVNQDEGYIYKSDLNGDHYEKIASFPEILPAPVKWKSSPDREKILYFNERQ
ncbi:MAG: PEGA domain-containing protein, partial [Deltaproteobacteria bacterium]